MNVRIRSSGSARKAELSVVPLRCPRCHQKGTFDPCSTNDLYAQDVETSNYYILGLRRCPDPTCGTQVFVILSSSGTRLGSYPAERIDFDATNIPATVIRSMEEAITSHANECFIAAAIMVRKTLEELCAHRKASGKNLKEKLRDLGTKIVLPKELLDGLDDLRLLGNDAAHIESQEFNQVGAEEVEIGLEFTKEVLKATYQYSALLNRLRGLKKQSATAKTP